MCKDGISVKPLYARTVLLSSRLLAVLIFVPQILWQICLKPYSEISRIPIFPSHLSRICLVYPQIPRTKPLFCDARGSLKSMWQPSYPCPSGLLRSVSSFRALNTRIHPQCCFVNLFGENLRRFVQYSPVLVGFKLRCTICTFDGDWTRKNLLGIPETTTTTSSSKK